MKTLMLIAILAIMLTGCKEEEDSNSKRILLEQADTIGRQEGKIAELESQLQNANSDKDRYLNGWGELEVKHEKIVNEYNELIDQNNNNYAGWVKCGTNYDNLVRSYNKLVEKSNNLLRDINLLSVENKELKEVKRWIELNNEQPSNKSKF